MAVRTVLYSEDRAAGGFSVDGSLLFNDGSAHKLERTLGTTGNTRSYTISTWVKTCKPGTRGVIMSATNNGVGSNEDGLEIDATPVRFYSYVGGSFRFQLTTTKKFRDTGWYHIVAMFDSVQVTDSDRAKIWINGELQTDLATATYPSQGAQAGYMNTSGQIQYIGSILTSHYWDGHIAQHHFIDGASLDASYFGYTDELTGIWRPKKYNYKTAGDITSTSYAIKSSEQSSDGQIATNAFDHAYSDAFASRWRNNGSEDGNIVGNAYIGQDFGSGNDKDIREVRLLQGRASSTGEMVTGVKIQYSDNGSSWSDASASITIDASTYAWQTIKAAPSGAHRYWRLLCSASSNSVWLVTEMSMHEYTNQPYYGTNGFYLPFDGNTSVGKDLSTSGNHFTPHNFEIGTNIDQATGALPILRTVSGGNWATSGVTEDPAASSCILAIPFHGGDDETSNGIYDVSHLINSGTTEKSLSITGARTRKNMYWKFYHRCGYFDASDDKVTLTLPAGGFGSGDFTLEYWAIHSGLTNYQTHFSITRGATGFNVGSDASGDFVWYDQGNGTGRHIEVVGAITTEDWHHYAYVRSNGVITGYLDGKAMGSFASTVNYSQTAASIGCLDGSSEYFDGHMQDLRIYVGAAKYTTDFIPASVHPSIVRESPVGAALDSDTDAPTTGSVTFDGSTSGYLYTNSSSADFTIGTGDFTIEFWVYYQRDTWSSEKGCIQFSSTSGGLTTGYSSNLTILTQSGELLRVNMDNTNVVDTQVLSDQRWYHIAVTRASGTVKMFVDGVLRDTDTSNANITSTYVSIGGYYNTSYCMEGYISNFRFVKGTAVYTSAFTPPTEPLTNITNTKLLCCQSTTDSTYAAVSPVSLNNAGQALPNTFNPIKCDTTQRAGTFPTLNYLAGSDTTAGELKHGNLWLEGSNYNKWGANFYFGAGGINSGKWYWEITYKNGTHASYSGVTSDLEQDAGEIALQNNKNWSGKSSYNTFSSTSSTTDERYAYLTATNQMQTFGYAIDIDAQKMYFYKSGALYFTDSTVNDISYAGELQPHSHNTNDGVSGANQPDSWYNFGQRPFAYPPPAGFKPLNYEELPRAEIVRPDRYVGITTYIGTGADRSVTGFNFQPDFLWIKDLNDGDNWVTVDSVRFPKMIKLNEEETEFEETGDISSLNHNGFSCGSYNNINQSNITYAAWGWKAGGNKGTFNVDGVGHSTWAATGVSGGTITPTGCSIGTKQGFSIIGYQGNSTTNATIPHGLSKAPSFVVIKSRSSNHGWGTMHRDVGQTGTTVDGAPEYYMMRLNTDDDRDNWSADTIWDPTTTTVKIHQSSSGYWVNHNSYHYMAYIWHDVDGFQKFGQYIGNGNNSGPFVYLGFRPAIVIVKRYNNDANWALCDDERNKYNNTWGSDKSLYLNTTGQETTSASFNVDLLSNGFKLRSDNSNFNADGDNYIYMAWARQPLNTLYGGHANAR